MEAKEDKGRTHVIFQFTIIENTFLFIYKDYYRKHY